MTRALLSLSFVCFTLGTARAEFSVEAKECFDWFETLGFPDVKDAAWVEVSFVSPKLTKALEASEGFVLEDTKDRFRVMGLDMLPNWYPRFDPAKPERQMGLTFVERPFLVMATSYLEKLRDPPTHWNHLRTIITGPRLGRRATVFALAHACWRKGEPDLAQQLFDEAKKIPTEGTIGQKEVEVPMRHSLELEFGHTAMWDALLRVGRVRWDSLTNGRELVPRTELLRLFQDIIRKYPASPHLERAKQIAVMLERMVEEDAAHPSLSNDEIAALPVEEQVREWIFRLRDQGGLLEDVFVRDVLDSPENRLVQIGYPAVPQLIDALSDDRFSREVVTHRIFYFSQQILTIGDSAERILRHITRQSFDPPRPASGAFASREAEIEAKKQVARAWWEQFQQKGEKQMLIDALSSGMEFPSPLVSQLKAKWPEAVEPALLAGADKARAGMKSEFIRALAGLNSPVATDRLRRFMREDPELWNRIAAARPLLDRDDPEAAPAMLAEWINFSAEPPDQFGHELPDQFEALTDCLIATGDVDAIKALRQKWDGLDAPKRQSIVEALGGASSMPMFRAERKPLSPEARDETIDLLVHSLEDFTLLGHSGLPGDTTPRICDRAAWALHRIQPETYSSSKKASRRQRDLERIIMVNTWRKAHNLEPLPVPETPPRLETQDALRITHFADLSPEVMAGEELRKKVIAWIGTELHGTTLPSLLQWIASTSALGIRGVEIDVRRDNDLRGVEVEMRLHPGESPTAASDWRIQLHGEVGAREFYVNPRASMKDPREDRYWREIIDETNEALHVPPETEFLIHAEIDAPQSVSF
jgi:hypothetical protein